MTLSSNFYNELGRFKSVVCNKHNAAEYASNYPNNTYKEAIEELDELKALVERSIELIEECLQHKHEWNENDYCDICFADGRS